MCTADLPLGLIRREPLPLVEALFDAGPGRLDDIEQRPCLEHPTLHASSDAPSE